jgi:hypothetical protein
MAPALKGASAGIGVTICGSDNVPVTLEIGPGDDSPLLDFGGVRGGESIALSFFGNFFVSRSLTPISGVASAKFVWASWGGSEFIASLADCCTATLDGGC